MLNNILKRIGIVTVCVIGGAVISRKVSITIKFEKGELIYEN